MVYLKHKNRSTPSRSKNMINKKERIIRESTENSENKKIFKRSKLTLNIMRSATKKFNFSLNQFIYSIQNFESMVVFYIDRTRCKPNDLVINQGKKFNHKDFRDYDNKSKISKRLKILSFLKKKLSFLDYKKYFN